MKKCKTCGIEKEFEKFYACPGCKDGYHGSCKECEKLKAKAAKPVIRKTKVEYRPTKKLINPTNPIPVKLVGEDGFGGKWNFDIEQLEKRIFGWSKANGQKNHMVRRNLKCWQIKTDDYRKIELFCETISMNKRAIIEFPKTDKTVYVVNLFHPNILEVLR